MSISGKSRKEQIYEIIFEADTPAGKAFDVIILICILISIGVIMLDSVQSIHDQYEMYLTLAEWFFTIVFSIEYMARIWVVLKKHKYIFSFFGLIDLLSILPTYIGLFISGAHSLLIIRSIRLLRVFRVLKLARFVGESQNLLSALKNSRHKIIVFLITVLTSVIIAGTLMFLIEGKENGFTSIPRSVYWAIVTMTTVGYGDIAPHTIIGQTVASVIMILGYAIIAVPTGIVSAEIISQKQKEKITTEVCPHCLAEGHDHDADYCKYCGSKLD